MRANKLSLKKIGAFATGLALAVAFAIGPCMQMEAFELAKGSQATVTFRAGEHGVFKGDTSIEKRVYTVGEYLSFVDVTNMVVPSAGYYVSGFKVVGTATERVKPTESFEVTHVVDVIPQYARIVKEASYQVNYVDRMGVQIAQPKVGLHQAGEELALVAPAIPGYSLTGSEYVKIKPEVAKTIGHTFVYASNTDADKVTETVVEEVIEEVVEEVVVVPSGGTGTTGSATGTGATGTGTISTGTIGTGTTGGGTVSEGSQVTVEDSETPLEDGLAGKDEPVEVEDGGVPLDESVEVKEDTSSNSTNSWLIYLVAAIVILAAVGTVIYLKTKRTNGNKK